MSTQDQITEILNAMDRNPELAEQLRARILGDDLPATTERLVNEQQAMAELLEKNVELSGAMANVMAAVQARQSRSDDAIAGLQRGQEAMQSAISEMRTDISEMQSTISEMRTDIDRLATNQSRMDAAIAQLQTDVETLKSDVAALKSDVETLKSDMVQVKERLDRIDGNLNRMNGRIDNMAGTHYEYKVLKNLASIAGQHLRLRRVRRLKGPYTDENQDLVERVYDAEDNGIITESENHDMWLLDLIFSGRRREDGKEVLVAGEVSITAGDNDILRVKNRAETLRKAAGTEVIPVVIAEHIDPERQEAADQAGVVFVPVPENRI